MAVADEAGKLLEGVGPAVDALERLAGTLPSITTNLGHFFEQFKSLMPAAERFKDTAGSLTEKLNAFGTGAINLGSNLEHVTLDLLGAAEGFDQLGGSALTSASSISEAAKALKEHVANVITIAEKLGGKIPGADMLISAFKNIGDNAIGAAERTQQLEKGFMALNVAGGDFKNVFDDNRGLTDIDSKMASFNEKMQQIASATGMAPKEISKSLTELSTIPTALSGNVKVAGESMDTLTAISKIAAGSMQETSQVIKDAHFAYENLSGDLQKQIQYSANLASAQQSLQLPMGDVRDAVQSVAGQFAMMSDNVDDTVKAMGLFIPAMEGVGLSGHQATKVFGDIMGAMSGLSDATESYISTTSGGAGGLQGVFAFEEKLANDKKGAAQDLMKTMKDSVGGEIVTRAEAAADISGQAASQYEKQREMWEKITGKKLDKGEEAKVFQAMKEGRFEGQGLEPPTGDKAVAKTAEQGSSVQDKMHTSVTEIRNAVNAIAAAQDIQLGISILNKDKQLTGADIAKHSKDAQGNAAAIERGSGLSPDELVKNKLIEAGEYAKNLATGAVKAFSDQDAAKEADDKAAAAKLAQMQTAAGATPTSVPTSTPAPPAPFIGPPPPPPTSTPVPTATNAPDITKAIEASVGKAKDEQRTIGVSPDEQNRAVHERIAAATAAASPVGPTASNVRTAAEAQQAAPPAAQPAQTTIAVTGEIKGVCIKCQQETMVDNVAATATAMTENRQIMNRTGGANRNA
jgi:hypothetical protein